jgi:predicted nucleic acid-binding protein
LLGRDMLLDTGPLVAALNARDQWHGHVAAEWPALVDRCITTEAVVTEACHLSAERGGSRTRPLEFLLTTDVPIVAVRLPVHRQCLLLMQKYSDTPMDYADATLVALSDILGIRRVFTTDRRGFGAYRGARGVPFEVLPK